MIGGRRRRGAVARALAVGVIALGLLASAACGGATSLASPNRAAFDIAEAVLRHMLAGTETSPATHRVDAVCVALGDRDVQAASDSSFLARFKDATPPVHPWSQCAYDTAHGDVLAYVPTGARAIGYALEWPRRVTSRRVLVSVAWHLSATDATGWSCDVRLGADDDWHVESCKRRWVA